MHATSAPSDTHCDPCVDASTPFAGVYVTITKQEHIELKIAAQYWQAQHRRAVGRTQWRELRYQRIARELKAQAAKSNAALQVELEFARAQVRDLQKRLFSRKSESGKHCETRAEAVTRRAPRGQRRGSVGHGRTLQTQLPARHEEVTLDKAQCPNCGLAFNSFAGTEDAGD